MSIKLTLANTPEILDGIYKARHKIFSEEDGKFQATADERIIDRYDAYPTSKNIAVLLDDQVIGGIRVTEDSAVGLPADESFDFRSHIPPNSKLFSCGMYCVQREFRSPRIALGLIMMASYLAISEGVTHVIAPINPAIARLLKRVGFTQLGEQFTEPHFGLPVLPMLLDISDLNDHFMNFVNKNDLHNFLNSYECSIFSKNETIIRAGEQDDTAYVIVDGEVEVRSKEHDVLLTNLKEGDIFGEMALFMDEKRSAHVTAKTDVKVMTLHKKAFLEHLETSPSQAIKIINTLGKRIQDLNDRIV